MTSEEIADRILEAVMKKTGMTKEEVIKQIQENFKNGTLLQKRKTAEDSFSKN